MARNLIEYNGEQLYLKTIANKEGLDPNTLKKYYIQIGDIYIAIEVCKENSRGKRGMTEKIEYNGELLTLATIAKKENLAWTTLKRYYTQTKDIYEAVELTKECSMGEREKVEYNGEKLTINAIAKIEGVDSNTLRKHYIETGDIYKSVQTCKKNARGKRQKIEYNGERIELTIIARREQVCEITLKRYYLEIGDIYEAIKLSKQNSIEKIEYNGEKLPLATIAKKEELNQSTLRDYYTKTKDIYEAIKLCKQNLQKKKIEYNGQQLSITAIAKKEGLNINTLRSHYERVNDIYEAIKNARKNSRKKVMQQFEGNQSMSDDIEKDAFVEQRKKQKSQKIKTKKTEVNLYDMSLVMSVRYTDLVNLLGKGMTTEEIKEKYANRQERKVRTADATELENGQKLLDVCIRYGLNYSYAYIAINEYGKTLYEISQSYKDNSKNIPEQWIYQKYGSLLTHLMRNDNINLLEIVEYLKNGNMLIKDVLEKYIIRKNAKTSNLNEDWIEELYGVITAEVLSEEELENFKTKLHVDENEEKCIEQSKNEIKTVKRKLELHEIYEAIKNGYYEENEVPELLQEFEVTPQEIDTLFVDLFYKYDGDMEPSKMQRKEIIKEIAKQWYYLNGAQREEALKSKDISPEEKAQIENMSRRIVRFKRMLNYQQTQEQQTQ